MTTAPSHLVSRATSLIDRSRHARTGLLAEANEKWVSRDRLDEVIRVHGETIELLESVERHYAPAAETKTETETEDSTPADDRAGTEEVVISDLAWLSRGEVNDCLANLDRAIDEGDSWRIVTAADTGLERSERALVALDDSIRGHEGLPRTEQSQARLRESVEVRRLYVALRRTFLEVEEPSGTDLLDELWALEVQLRAIQRLEIFGVIRIDDRVQLHALHSRIEEALAQPYPERESDRRRLWQDLEGFSHLLLAIHNREDLRRHDLELLERVRQRVETSDDESEVRFELRHLGPLLGRDPGLDRLLLLNPDAPLPTDDVDSILHRLEIDLRMRAGFG